MYVDELFKNKKAKKGKKKKRLKAVPDVRIDEFFLAVFSLDSRRRARSQGACEKGVIFLNFFIIRIADAARQARRPAERVLPSVSKLFSLELRASTSSLVSHYTLPCGKLR